MLWQTLCPRLVEARLPVDKYESGRPTFSSGLPDQGLVVYLIDESSWPPVHLLKEGMDAAGESFIDRNSGITISVAQKLASGFDVKIQRDIPLECERLKEDIKGLTVEVQHLDQQLENEEDESIRLELQREIREKRSQRGILRRRAQSLGCNI
jgi:hypothetical protein